MRGLPGVTMEQAVERCAGLDVHKATAAAISARAMSDGGGQAAARARSPALHARYRLRNVEVEGPPILHPVGE